MALAAVSSISFSLNNDVMMGVHGSNTRIAQRNLGRRMMRQERFSITKLFSRKVFAVPERISSSAFAPGEST